jgi:hypothetical protein
MSLTVKPSMKLKKPGKRDNIPNRYLLTPIKLLKVILLQRNLCLSKSTKSLYSLMLEMILVVSSMVPVRSVTEIGDAIKELKAGKMHSFKTIYIRGLFGNY